MGVEESIREQHADAVEGVSVARSAIRKVLQTTDPEIMMEIVDTLSASVDSPRERIDNYNFGENDSRANLQLIQDLAIIGGIIKSSEVILEYALEKIKEKENEDK